ncbi:hypothetical protein DRQ11_13815 [candidate division KSB1 bacterium]|nr:MAG: hypothetical protein DRQ11_13815 [candidate division KSB1 bacterium]
MADSNITLVKRMYHGPGRVVCVHDNYAYVGADAALLVFDVSNPDEPVLKGCTYTLSNIAALKAKGNMLYVRHSRLTTSLYPYEALEIFDISDPTNPAKVGSFRAVWLIKFSVDESGKYVYTIYKKTFDQPFTFGILDVSDPTNPQIIGNYVSTNGSIMDHFCVGSHAYVTQHISKYENNVLITKDTLQVLDISNPSNPTLIGAYSITDSLKTTYSFFVVDFNYVCLVTRIRGESIGYFLEIIDFSDPSRPVELSSVRLSVVGSPFVSDSLVYFINFSNDSLLVGGVDITDPAAPIEVGHSKYILPPKIYPFQPFVSHDLIYAAGVDLIVLDASDLNDVKERGSCHIEDVIHELDVYGNYAYLAQGMDGVRILDVSDPTNPQEVGVYQNGKEIKWIIASDEYVLLPAYPGYEPGPFSQFTLIDVTDPTSPREIGSFNLKDKALRIFISGDTLYCAMGWGGIEIYQVSSSDTLTEIVNHSTGEYVYDIWISNNLAYVLDSPIQGGYLVADSLRILDLTDLSDIKEIGKCGISMVGKIRKSSMLVSSTRAILPLKGYTFGFVVVDISDCFAPKEVAVYRQGTSAFHKFRLWEDHVFFIANEFPNKVLVLDTSDPTNLKRAGSFELVEHSMLWGVSLQDVSENFIYLTVSSWPRYGNNGLFILKFTPPTGVVELSPGSDVPDRFSLQQNYPNPFNLNTVIRYSLPGKVNRHVSLKIYNLLGQQVQVLIDDELQRPGCYSVKWDGKDKQGKDVASGIYLYQLKAGDFVEMKKMIVLR